MNKLLSLVIILIANIAVASPELPQIIAVVNDQPITAYEFQSRKNMLKVLHGIKSADASLEKQIDDTALQGLVQEAVLIQHFSKIGNNIPESVIDKAISYYEQQKKMPKAYMSQLLAGRAGDYNSFRSQIRSELLKMNIFSYITKSVIISPKEIDYALLTDNGKDAKITAKIFTSIDKNPGTLKKMQALKKQLAQSSNAKVLPKTDFAKMLKIEQSLSTLDDQLKIVVKDLSAGQVSGVFEALDGFKLILVDSKVISNFSINENEQLVTSLTNKKMLQKAQKFLDDLRSKSYVKIMLPG